MGLVIQVPIFEQTTIGGIVPNETTFRGWTANCFPFLLQTLSRFKALVALTCVAQTS